MRLFMPPRLAHRSVLACFVFHYSRLVCRFHVGSRIVSLFHPQRIVHLHLFKKKKKLRPLSAVPESLHFFPIEWVRAKQMRLAPGLSLSLSLLYTSKETWEHESVVLTTTYAHTPNPYIQLTIIENKSPAALSKAAKKKKISHRAHTMREEGKRETRETREGRRGGGRSKEAK